MGLDYGNRTVVDYARPQHRAMVLNSMDEIQLEILAETMASEDPELFARVAETMQREGAWDGI